MAHAEESRAGGVSPYAVLAVISVGCIVRSLIFAARSDNRRAVLWAALSLLVILAMAAPLD